MAAPVFATNDVPTAAQVNDWFVGVNYVEKASDLSRASTVVLTDDPELSLPVVANAKYLMTCLIIFSATSQSAGDLNIGFSVPSGTTILGHATGPPVAGTSAADDITTAFSESGTMSFGVIGIAAPWTTVLLTGRVAVSSTAGTLKIRWSQAFSNATNTTLRVGSSINLDRKS
jgi:hypothetical protein